VGALLVGDVHLGKAPRRRRLHRRNDLRNVWSDEGPSPQAQHHYGNLAALKILLVAEILVRGDKYLETCRLGWFSNSPFSNSSHRRGPL